MELLQNITLSDIIESPYQGRLIYNDESGTNISLESLKRSIKESGLMQAIVVRECDKGYEIIDGHRRTEACKQLGIENIQAIVKTCTEEEAQVMTVIGNLQREDLSNIEKALAFKKVLDQEIFKDKRELSKAIGKDETYVGDLLNTVNMDKRIIADLLQNKTTNDVRLLRAIRGIERVNEEQLSEKQWELYQRFQSEGLSRAEIQSLVKTTKEKPAHKYTVVGSAHKIHIQLHEKISKDKREMISKMIAEKMDEIMKLI